MHQFQIDAQQRVNEVKRSFTNITQRFEEASRLPSFRNMRYNQLIMNEIAVKKELRRLELYFYDWIQQGNGVSEITYLNLQGAEQLHVSESEISRNLSDRSQEPEVVEILAQRDGKTVIRESHVDASLEHAITHDNDHDHSDLIWWVPVEISSGKNQGVLRFYLHAEFFQKRFQHLVMAEIGTACVVSDGGNLLFSSSHQQRCEEREGFLNFSEEVELPGQRLTFIVSVDPERYFVEVQETEKRIYRFILPSVALFVLLIIGIFTTRFTNQIRQLVYKAEHMGGEGSSFVSSGAGNELLTLEEAMDYSANLIERNRASLNAFNQELEQQVETRTAELTKASQAKDEFLASMSHELRTPLTSIIGNSEFLIDGGLGGGAECDQKEASQVLRAIQSAGHNQLALVNDILDMSKIESGKFTIDEAPYNLAALLADLQSMLSVRVQDAGLKWVVTQNNQESRLLMGDASRIAQILINLVSNAIKFTDTGCITVTTRVADGKLKFRVEDEGIGMSPEVMSRLFTRFEQADSSIGRRFGGSGLGLFISINLAELMGGEINVSSEEGVGSVFELMIPYQPSDIFVRDQQEDANESLLDEQLSGHILIAEDTPELQLLERRILESVGLTVTAVVDGQQAVDQVNQNHFDLILMDMQMPVMDGIEATRTLRQQGHTLPIIALTANVMQKHRDAFNEAGCDGFLGKPIDKTELRRELKQHLLQRQEKIVEPPSQAEEEVDDELMAIFREGVVESRDKLTEAFSNKVWSDVRAVAHRVKGSAVSFGYPELSQMAEALQFAIDEERVDEVPALTKVLLTEFDRVLS